MLFRVHGGMLQVAKGLPRNTQSGRSLRKDELLVIRHFRDHEWLMLHRNQGGCAQDRQMRRT